MKVYHYSVGRSGCTFISQVLVGVFGRDSVEAGHEPYLLESGQPVIVSVRDFRDVVLSYWRVQNDIPFKDIERGRKASLKDIEPQLTFVKHSIEQHLGPTVHNNDRSLLLRYEEFFPDKFDFIFAEFERFFDIKVGKKKRKELQQAYSFKRNKYKASKMQSFQQYDKEFIHGLHLHNGKVGGWQDLLQQDYHQALNQQLATELKDWGYSCSAD